MVQLEPGVRLALSDTKYVVALILPVYLFSHS